MEDKFIVLKHSMIRRTDLTMQEKIVYLEILSLSSLEKGCIASNNHFELSFGISKKSVSNTISSLIKKGFIESELTNRNHKRVLSIKDGGLSTKDGQVSIKSVETKENKTSNRTNNNKNKQKDSLDLKVLENFVLEKNVLEFIQHRKEKKKPLTQLAFDKFFNKVLKYLELNYNVAELIDNSITAGYTDIYEPKKQNNFKQQKQFQTKAEKNRSKIDEYAEFFGHNINSNAQDLIETCEVIENEQ